MGFRGNARPRWPGFPSSVSGNEKRVCEWHFPLCRNGFQETVYPTLNIDYILENLNTRDNQLVNIVNLSSFFLGLASESLSR